LKLPFTVVAPVGIDAVCLTSLQPEVFAMTDIFTSYRSTDAAGRARGLHRDLCMCFPPEQIFFDQETIESGGKFHERAHFASFDLFIPGPKPAWSAEPPNTGPARTVV
jgi:hypothetical protein